MTWHRLHYGGRYHRWHIVRDGVALCGLLDLAIPAFLARLQTALRRPAHGKICRKCEKIWG